MHAEHLLHRFRRQTDLVAAHHRTRLQALPDVRQLHLVRVDDIDLGIGLGEGCDDLLGDIGVPERERCGRKLLGVQHATTIRIGGGGWQGGRSALWNTGLFAETDDE